MHRLNFTCRTKYSRIVKISAGDTDKPGITAEEVAKAAQGL